MINKVTLIGNVGQDPEIRTLENGTPVGRFSLATNESYKDKEGNWQTQTEWHNVVVWRELATRADQLKKGGLVYVEGKIQARKYTDREGIEKTSVDIVASTFRLLEKKERPADAPQQSEQPQAAPPQRQPVSQGQQKEPWQADHPNPDDLPF